MARKKKTDQKPVEDPKSDEAVEFTSQREGTSVDADEPAGKDSADGADGGTDGDEG